jgi:chemotaxis response regulator CheB
MRGRNLVMASTPATYRIYIVFHHALFAQGIRSLLRGRRAMQVVGMESDPAKALEAVGSLQPEVVIVEESDAGIQSPTLTAILQRHPAGRVVALDLDHNFATVYDRHRVVTTQPTDLVRAIRVFPRDRGDPAPRGTAKSSRVGRTRGETALASLARRVRQR